MAATYLSLFAGTEAVLNVVFSLQLRSPRSCWCQSLISALLTSSSALPSFFSTPFQLTCSLLICRFACADFACADVLRPLDFWSCEIRDLTVCICVDCRNVTVVRGTSSLLCVRRSPTAPTTNLRFLSQSSKHLKT